MPSRNNCWRTVPFPCGQQLAIFYKVALTAEHATESITILMSNIIKHWFVDTNKSILHWKPIPFEVHLQKCNERPGLLWSILASRSASRSDGLFGGKGNHHLAKLIFTMVHFHILCYYTLFHTSTGYILEKAKFGPKQFHLDLCHFRL